MSTMLTLIKISKAHVYPETSLNELIRIDRAGFRPPEREIEVLDCQKADRPGHECHGPHSVCPSCDLEFCSEEYADEGQTLCHLCTDCWAKYIDLFEWHHYPNNR